MIILSAQHITNEFDGKIIHQDLDFFVKKGEITAIVGGSGCGKTTLFRSLLRLQPPTEGQIKLFDVDMYTALSAEIKMVLRRIGVLFQHSALFSSLTVLDNVLYVLNEFTRLPEKLLHKIALLKISLVGLPQDAAYKYPAELSGGMQKRAAMARALALEPEILFLDEPTAGLDPQSAGALDELVAQLCRSLQLTVVMITHDLDTLWQITDRVAFMGEGKVIAHLPMKELVFFEHPLIEAYFSGPRSQRFIKNP